MRRFLAFVLASPLVPVFAGGQAPHRTAIRAGTEMSALASHQPAFRKFIEEAHGGLTKALTQRDSPFGDYRTSEPHAQQ